MADLPEYPEGEPVDLRLARCIQHALGQGGGGFEAAQAILRDIRLGYIVIPHSAGLATCKHLRVVQYDSHDGILCYFHERRECPDCGLKEESYFGSYKTALGEVQFIKHVRR